MSDNPMRLAVAFTDNAAAEAAAGVFRAAQDWIFAGSGEERYLGDYLAAEGLASGIAFDSFWVPSGPIEVADAVLSFELVGSPGDSLPGDVVLWLGRQGAIHAGGSLTISGTGDVIEIDHSFG